MKNITECNPTEYSCFYYWGGNDEVSLYIPAPSGDLPYLDYEQFLTENGSVIAFKELPQSETHYAYKAVSSSDEFLIQFQTYETIIDAVDGVDDHTNGYYILFNSKPFQSSSAMIIGEGERCDTEIYSSMVFFELSDGTTSPLTDPDAVTRGNLEKVVPILSIPGSASIMRAHFKVPKLTYFNYKIVTTVSRTLLGSLRLACEWRETTKSPFNSLEVPAQKIASFADLIGIDESLQEEIFSAQNPMPVSLFLSDPENSRVQVVENREFTDAIRSWIKPMLRYRTLTSLRKNLSLESEIPLSLVEDESTLIKTTVYSYCLKNSIDIPSINDYEELRLAVGSEKVENFRLGINELVEKMIGL